ncbi:MAG: hypothetical protein IIZ94_08815, partial [Prevotella sp.]|nr:hypothetical protein [Prevotella sp.]
RMIKTEIIGNLIKTYSDLGVKIHGGLPEADYDEAYDPIDSGRTYTETDIPIDETSAEEIVNILTGEEE